MCSCFHILKFVVNDVTKGDGRSTQQMLPSYARSVASFVAFYRGSLLIFLFARRTENVFPSFPRNPSFLSALQTEINMCGESVTSKVRLLVRQAGMGRRVYILYVRKTCECELFIGLFLGPLCVIIRGVSPYNR